MNSRLKIGQVCPIHRRRDCCGREPLKPRLPKYPQRNGVTFMSDGREVCTPAKLRERKLKLLNDSRYRACATCGEAFQDFRDVELSHKVPKGMNGGKRDDRWENLTLCCVSCNRECGSRTLADYLVWRQEKGLPTP